MAPEIVDNKMSIFPFDANIEGTLGPQKGKVFKINLTGMMIEVFHSGFITQSAVKLKFNLPIDNAYIEINGKVMKTYNQHRGEKIQYFIEVHFSKLTVDQQDAIDVFIRKNNALARKGAEKSKARSKVEE